MKRILNIHSYWSGLILLILLCAHSSLAHALPSFARQTGMACSTCHTQSFGPNLTSFGRQFKLNGYTQGSNESLLSRFSGMAMGSLTNTQKNDDDLANDPTVKGANANNNLAFDQASLFYGGKVFGQMGAFVQFTYDGVGKRFFLDNTDIRIASDLDWLGQNLVYGVSFNNNPSVQDLWNTTPTWSFPYTKSVLARTPAAGPVIASLAGQAGGASLYTMINDTVFLEAGAYSSFSQDVQQSLGTWNGAGMINGGAPYWRIALQKEWQGHYFSLGHFGFRANIQPPGVITPKTDRYTDLGMDFNYQYLGNPENIYEFKASYIREKQELYATYHQLGGAVQLNQNLGFLGLNASYTYQQAYAISLGYNHINDDRDNLLYSSSPTNTPNSEYFTAEFDYVPFGKTATSGAASYLNLRFAVQYVAYTRFDGGNKNYDGSGRNASDNNTLYLNSWLIF